MVSILKYDTSRYLTYAHEASCHLDKDLWAVTKPLTYYIGEAQSRELVTVPVGYLVCPDDLPSVVRFLLPLAGHYGQVAVLYSYLREVGEVGHCVPYSQEPLQQPVEQSVVDRVLFEVMGVVDVPYLLRGLIRFGVWLHRTSPETLRYSARHPIKTRLERMYFNRYSSK